MAPVLSAAELGETFNRSRGACARGDSFLRNAEFDRADQCYRGALATDPRNVNAHLGLGRIARLQFQRKTALDSIDTAFRLDPGDPDILLAYSEYASIPRVRDAIHAALKGSIPPQDLRIRQVVANLQIAGATGERTLNRVDGPYRGHRLKLSPFFPLNSTSYGSVLKVSLNGRNPLRLVLDTGARGIVLSGKSFRDFGLEPIAESAIAGLGSGAQNSARVTLAQSLEIGDLRLENCIVEVSEKSFVSGADGVIGTNVFQEFLLQLDFWSQNMDLVPFPDHQPADRTSDPWLDRNAAPDSRLSGLTPIYRVGHLLAVNAAVDDRANGLFVLDTGSAYNIVSPELLYNRVISAGPSLRGAQGTTAGQITGSPVIFRLAGGPSLSGTNVVAGDLTAMSRHEGVKIAGLLGYSAVSKSTLIINYRDGAIAIAPHGCDQKLNRSDN